MVKIMKLLVKHMHPKTQNQNLKTLKIPMTLTDSSSDSIELMKLLRSSQAIWNMLKISLSQLTTITPFLCLTWEIPFAASQKHVLTNYNLNKHCFKCTYAKLNGADGNSLGSLRITTCTLEFPKNFQ